MKANKGKIEKVWRLGGKIHRLPLGGHLGGMVIRYRRLGMNIFTMRAISRRVSGCFCPDHLHVGINLLHQLPQAIRLLFIVWTGWVLSGRGRIWNGNLAKVPKRRVLGHP